MRWGVIAAALLVAGCGGRLVPPGGASQALPSADYNRPAARLVAAIPLSPQPVGVVGAGVTSAVAAGVLAGPAVAQVPFTDEQAVRALAAFRSTCTSLLRRTDTSGLTRNGDWQAPCDAARAVPDGNAAQFFAAQFEAVQVGDGKATATGYYEPEILGARERRDGYAVPIYARPDDLIEVDLGLFSLELKGKRIRGKVAGRGFVPYDDRAQIDAGRLTGRARVLAWAADPVELFFLQVQGSGRLRLPDGGVLRIGYDSQNGRDYTGIGQLMLQRGLLAPGQASMQGIMDWLRAHPEQGRAIMDENKSFVFFRELSGAPLGALGLPVTGGTSVAADPRFIPLGAPVLLSLDRADANGLWIAQDTGGAIKGTNRVDTFWGAGPDARATAGGMKARGTAWVLVPVGTLARLAAEAVLAERPLDPDEAALWRRVVETVRPAVGRAVPTAPVRRPVVVVAVRGPVPSVPPPPKPTVAARPATLDGTWDRLLAKGQVAPDRTVDLHGDTLDRAYGRIDAALAEAVAAGERVAAVRDRQARWRAHRPWRDPGGRRRLAGGVATSRADRCGAQRPPRGTAGRGRYMSFCGGNRVRVSHSLSTRG